MATAATSLLGLALPVTGELSGTWGDTVNVSITALLDTAVAGTTTLSSDADVTLTTTTLAANQARQAIILWTAGGTVTRTITVPAQSKSYIVINKTSSSQSIKIVGAGPTTGVTIVAGTAAFVVWNGVDFVTASVTSTTGILPVANGGTGLSSGTSGGVLAYTATGTLASSAALAASALVIGGGAGAAPSTTTTGTGVVTALGVNTGTAGAFVVNGGALGSPSSVGTMPAFTLGGTVSGGGNQINNVIIGTSTPLAGAFTTLSSASNSSTATGLSLTNVQTNNGYNQILLQGSGGSNIYGVALRQSTTNTAVHGGDFDLLCADSSNVLTSRIRVVGSNGTIAVTGTFSSTLGATIQGLTVGLGAGAVATNTAVGASALAANTSGAQNTTVGNQAGATTNAAYLTAVGYQAARYNTGDGNTAIGTNALLVSSGLNGTGTNNVAVGKDALYQNTTASSNTAVGYQSGYQTTTGGGNAFFGISAGYNVTSGTNNAYFGNSAGPNSGYASTSSNNTGIGTSALGYLTSGANNTAVGYQAGITNSTGTGQTFIGQNAGRTSNPSAATGYNTIIGNQAGYYLTTGVDNTFIGSSVGRGAGQNMTEGSKNTIIGTFDGNEDSLDIRTADNYVVLSDGAGKRQITMKEGQTLALDSAVPNAGTGITFPATQSASTNANTLDDYEEGTWEPSVGGTATYTQQQGSYIKVGRLVTVSFDMAILLLGTGSTSDMTGLPFTVGSATSPKMEQCFGAMGYVQSLAVNVYSLIFYAAANGTTIYSISMNTLGGTANVNPAIYGNGTRVQGTVTYMAVN